jgi:hypothetical protein
MVRSGKGLDYSIGARLNQHEETKLSFIGNTDRLVKGIEAELERRICIEHFNRKRNLLQK